jgi:rhodanese-related sulfurtransferase
MNLITRDELRIKLARGDEFKLVMTMPERAYRAKHIPGSHHAESVEHALALFDPAEEIVVYCADVCCAASIYAYWALVRRGYPRVRRYAGGLADWEAAGYPLERGRAGEEAATAARRAPRRRATLAPVRPAARPWLVAA